MIRRRARGRSPESDLTPAPAWRRIDLHLHTPGSSDYQEPDATYLDILRQAEARGLDIIAFTDHNSVAGYAAMREEVARLEFLEERQRLLPDEADRLAEYRRLAARLLILPGFEFTATFGFHILGIFPETTTVRKLEHLLLALNVPEAKLAHGSSEVGATADVLTAYEVIASAGGLVIGAHVNSTHGVAMVGLGLGGQTKIAYTQDENLHALEVTDLDSTNRRSTARFFNGTKPEYPRQMHCIQGSDAHRVERDPRRPDKNLGIGDRCTEVLLPEPTFAALKALLTSNDFGRTRPYQPLADPFTALLAARQAGETATQAFHDAPTASAGGLDALLRDIVGFANTTGGVLYLGAAGDATVPIRGIERPADLTDHLQAVVARQIVPPLPLHIDTLTGEGRAVLAVTVPQGPERPYAVDPGHIFIRRDTSTVLAPRDEVVRLVRSTLGIESEPAVATSSEANEPVAVAMSSPPPAAPASDRARATGPVEPSRDFGPALPLQERLPIPRTGVEIVSSVERNGVPTHTVRDLRNRRVIRNVTRASATRLWRYAVIQREESPPDLDAVRWDERDPRLGYLSGFVQPEGIQRYNLVFHDPAATNGAEPAPRVFYGVTEDGIDERWKALLPPPETLPTIDFDQLPAVQGDEPVGPSPEPRARPEPAPDLPLPVVGADLASPGSTVPYRYSTTRSFNDPPRSELAAHAPDAIAPPPRPVQLPPPTPSTALPAGQDFTATVDGQAAASAPVPPVESEPATAPSAKPRRRRAPRKPRQVAVPPTPDADRVAPESPRDTGSRPPNGAGSAGDFAAHPVERGTNGAPTGAPAASEADSTLLAPPTTTGEPVAPRRRRPARRRVAAKPGPTGESGGAEPDGTGASVPGHVDAADVPGGDGPVPPGD